MLLLAVLAAAGQPSAPARVAVTIVRAQRVTRREWEGSTRRREVMRREGGRPVTLRLMEFE